ncbi:MAG: hypothetical protein JW915_05700 [Chitinispirillaceae bacterium]|nr:hypothetical protein [Chitinispirillaceae bacterium]
MLRSPNKFSSIFENYNYLLFCCGIVILLSFLINAEDIKKSARGFALDTIQQREMAAREQIALEQAKIGNLKQDLQACTGKLTDALNERYRLLNTDKHGYDSVNSSLDSIAFYLENFLFAGVVDISDNIRTIDSLYSYAGRLKATTRFIRLRTVAKKIQVIEDLYLKISEAYTRLQREISSADSSGIGTLDAVEEPAMVSAVDSGKPSDLADIWIVSTDSSTSESLFKIAGYDQVYGDPYKWRKLYLANKELIDKNYEKFQKNKKTDVSINPQDILFPGQVLRIPR